MKRDEIWQAVEYKHQFNQQIDAIEQALRPHIPPAFWPHIVKMNDLALHQAVCCLELALNDKRPGLAHDR